ncbi:MAG: DNA mismatch endonuclease Vsr [Bacteroidetes bacterium]|nr:DNA mismatch endonuclease Vsr [Bacteroidota bacterium]
MTDIYKREERSNLMSKISGKETKPEIIVRKFLFSKGFRYRKNVSNLPGKPDIVLPKYKSIIFVHGCFWHNHNCKAAKLPDTRKEFWTKKISDNKTRDEKNRGVLKKMGWKVFIVWECEIKNKNNREKRLELLINQITQNEQLFKTS